MNEGFMVKNQYGQYEVAPESEDDFGNVAVGEVVRVKMDMPRNLGFHRKFFVLLKVAFDNQDRFDNFDIFRRAVLVESGYCSLVKVEDRIIFLADSISFANCDELKFRAIYDKVLDVLCEKYCHGVSQEEMDKKVLAILEFS
jgi:hypothetical protein